MNGQDFVVIEDIGKSKVDNWKVIDFILKQNENIDTYLVDANPKKYLYLIKKK